MTKCIGYAAQKAKDTLSLWQYEVRELRDDDIEIDIKYSGICHTDIHMIDNDWDASLYPMVPGHEIAGVVARVGKNVTRFKAGDKVGVGCMIWSCRNCKLCKDEAENYCKDVVLTYSGRMPDGEVTYGGYANKMVAPESFAVAIPASFGLDYAAPLLCAGITCWSPMKYLGMDKPGKRIGIIGCGGLGHMAIQFGAAFGNPVTVISTSARKEPLARKLGATDFCISTDPESVKQHEGTLDFLVDTVSAEKPLDLYLSLLDVNGVLCTVGLPEGKIKLPLAPADLIWKRKSIVGSVVGSVAEMEEMMEFCAKKNCLPMIETVPATYVNEAIERVKKNDVKFRFVLDIENTMPKTC